MSRIERKQGLINTSYLVELFNIFIFDRIVCFGDFLPLRTLCDAYHKELAFNPGHICGFDQVMTLGAD